MLSVQAHKPVREFQHIDHEMISLSSIAQNTVRV